ncbi:hypothetical protein HKD37_06G016373 [Glycine soja]
MMNDNYGLSLLGRTLDEDMTKSKGKDPLEGLGGPMTRARPRKAKEALQQVLSILFEYKPKFQGEKSKVTMYMILHSSFQNMKTLT